MIQYRSTGDEVSAMLTNPTYAFGMVLEPQNEISDWVKAFNFVVPEKFWWLPLTMQLEVYHTFFQWLEENDFVIVASEAPVIVPVVDWLHTQKVIAKVNKMKQLNEEIISKAELVSAFVQAVVTKSVEIE